MKREELIGLAQAGQLAEHPGFHAVGWAGPLPAVGEIVYRLVDTDHHCYEQWVIGQATPRLGVPAVVELPMALVRELRLGSVS